MLRSVAPPSRPSAFAPACFLGLAAALAAQSPSRNVSGGPLRADQACFDVLHYELALRVDPETKSIAGTLAMRAKAVADCGVIALDLDPALAAESATWDGAPAKLAREGGRLRLEPATKPAAGAEF